MRQEVLEELAQRIENLRKIAKPNDIETGMSGSFICFNYFIQSHTAMTKEEFDSCVYDDWLREHHDRVYNEINKCDLIYQQYSLKQYDSNLDAGSIPAISTIITLVPTGGNQCRVIDLPLFQCYFDGDVPVSTGSERYCGESVNAKDRQGLRVLGRRSVKLNAANDAFYGEVRLAA